MSERESERLFDADFLRRLRSLFHRLRRRRPLRKKGGQATPAPGFTREFRDFRQYTHGDDFRSIDWRLFARAERLFVRLYEEIQELNIHILLDCSASMGEPHPAKRTCALRLAAALGYLALLNEHRVSLHSFAETMQTELPPRKGQNHIHAILKRLAALRFQGATDFAALRRFRPGRQRRGIVFLISDLLGRDTDTTVDALSVASSWPAETHVIHVVDPQELEPAFRGEVTLVDVETGDEKRIYVSEADAAAHAQRHRRFQDTLVRTCRRGHIDYVAWTTDHPFERGFLELLARGNVLSRA